MLKPDYTAQKITGNITVDGNLDKPEWKEAAWSKRFVDMVTGQPGMYNTQTALLWNEQYLYIAFYAEEPFTEAYQTTRDSIVFLENDLEVFIDGEDCYYELEVNAANTVYEVFFIWKDAYTQSSRLIHRSLMYITRRHTPLAETTTAAAPVFGKALTRAAYAGPLPILICPALKRQ